MKKRKKKKRKREEKKEKRSKSEKGLTPTFLCTPDSNPYLDVPLLVVGVRERSGNVDSCDELPPSLPPYLPPDQKSCSDFDENFLIISL